MKTIISSDAAPSAIGPYSQAVRMGNLVFLSGQIPIVPATGQLAEGGIAQQTEQVFKNLKAVLAEAGLAFDDVVKTTVFMKSLADFGQMNDVYAQHFPSNPPARSTVEVARLPRDVQVEIDAIAMVP
jgi:2-iminobutanoate/2-iminopropanoate deaminase